MKRFSTAWGRSTLLAGAMLLALVACSPEGDKYTSRANDSLNRFETIAEFDHNSENGIASGFVVYQDEVYYADPVRAELVCASAERPAIPIPEALFYEPEGSPFAPEEGEEPEASLSSVRFVEAGERLYAFRYSPNSGDIFYFEDEEWSEFPLEVGIWDYAVLGEQLYLTLRIREKDPTSGLKDSRFFVVKVGNNEISSNLVEIDSNIVGKNCIWAVAANGDVVRIDRDGDLHRVANLHSDLGADTDVRRPLVIVGNEKYAVIQWYETSEAEYFGYVARKVILTATGDKLMTEQEIGDPMRTLQVQRADVGVDGESNLWFLEDLEIRGAKDFGIQRLYVFDGEKLHHTTLGSKARIQILNPAIGLHPYGAVVAGMSMDWSLAKVIMAVYPKADGYVIDVRFQDGEFTMENINIGESTPGPFQMMEHDSYIYFANSFEAGPVEDFYYGRYHSLSNRLSRYAVLPTSQ